MKKKIPSEQFEKLISLAKELGDMPKAQLYSDWRVCGYTNEEKRIREKCSRGELVEMGLRSEFEEIFKEMDDDD